MIPAAVKTGMFGERAKWIRPFKKKRGLKFAVKIDDVSQDNFLFSHEVTAQQQDAERVAEGRGLLTLRQGPGKRGVLNDK